MMLCAGGELNKDACKVYLCKNRFGVKTQTKVDSGGPLTVDLNGKHVLIGVVSWGHGCGEVS